MHNTITLGLTGLICITLVVAVTHGKKQNLFLQHHLKHQVQVAETTPLIKAPELLAIGDDAPAISVTTGSRVEQSMVLKMAKST